MADLTAVIRRPAAARPVDIVPCVVLDTGLTPGTSGAQPCPKIDNWNFSRDYILSRQICGDAPNSYVPFRT